MISRTTTFSLPALLALLAVLSGCQQFASKRWPWTKDAAATTSALSSVTHEPLRPEQKADIQIVLAGGLERQERLDEAGDMYLKAIEADPSRSDAHHRLALLYERQGRSQAADTHYRQALELDGENPNLHCDIGYSHYFHQRWPEAESSLRRAIQLSPGLRRAHNNLGLVLARTGREQEAFDEFARAGCNRAEAHSNLAFAMSLSNRWNEAEVEFQRALDTDPDLLPARNGLDSLRALLAKQPPHGPKFNQPVSEQQASLISYDAPVPNPSVEPPSADARLRSYRDPFPGARRMNCE